MKTSKEVALTICEKIQNEYPKRPLWQTMLEIEDLIDRHVAKQLAIHGVVEQSEQLVCEYCNEDAKPTCCDNCLERMVNAVQKAN